MWREKLKNVACGVRRNRTNGVRPSYPVTNPTVIGAFVTNPAHTFLVSFPRTGSHWLRMIMELYFERPSLTRVFYYPRRKNYLTLHSHDLELDVARSHVIYLYRDPVDTIHSQLQYHREDVDDRRRIAHWADLYGRHLDKWLHRETFTRRKTVLRYERLEADLAAEFGKVCGHFNVVCDSQRLSVTAARVSKENVKARTRHDPRVMDLTEGYERTRRRFREDHGEYVWQVLTHGREHVRNNF